MTNDSYRTSLGRRLVEPTLVSVPRTTVSFVVEGRARPQGSKKGIVDKRTGRVLMIDMSKHLGPWRKLVAQTASEAMGTSVTPWDGPAGISLTFVYLRPKNHFRTGRFSDQLKPDAPAWPTTRSVPDVDKTERAIFDGITGVVLADDSQICTTTTKKVWGWPERVEVSVALLGPGLDYDQDEAREAA